MSFPRNRKKNRSLEPKRTFSVNLDLAVISALDREADRRRTCRSAVVSEILARALLTRASRAPGAECDPLPLRSRATAKIAITVSAPGVAPRTYEAFVPKNEIAASLRTIAEHLTIEA